MRRDSARNSIDSCARVPGRRERSCVSRARASFWKTSALGWLSRHSFTERLDLGRGDVGERLRELGLLQVVGPDEIVPVHRQGPLHPVAAVRDRAVERRGRLVEPGRHHLQQRVLSEHLQGQVPVVSHLGRAEVVVPFVAHGLRMRRGGIALGVPTRRRAGRGADGRLTGRRRAANRVRPTGGSPKERSRSWNRRREPPNVRIEVLPTRIEDGELAEGVAEVPGLNVPRIASRSAGERPQVGLPLEHRGRFGERHALGVQADRHDQPHVPEQGVEKLGDLRGRRPALELRLDRELLGVVRPSLGEGVRDGRPSAPGCRAPHGCGGTAGNVPGTPRARSCSAASTGSCSAATAPAARGPRGVDERDVVDPVVGLRSNGPGECPCSR